LCVMGRRIPALLFVRIFYHMITLKRSQTANGAGGYTLIVSNGKKFLCPAWIEVPMETTMEDIIVEEAPKAPRVEPSPDKEWEFVGSKGNIYTVARKAGGYSCTCPASMFQKFKDCKHIVQAKNEAKD